MEDRDFADMEKEAVDRLFDEVADACTCHDGRERCNICCVKDGSDCRHIGVHAEADAAVQQFACGCIGTCTGHEDEESPMADFITIKVNKKDYEALRAERDKCKRASEENLAISRDLIAERDALQAQLATAREEGRKEMREEAAKVAEAEENRPLCMCFAGCPDCEDIQPISAIIRALPVTKEGE